MLNNRILDEDILDVVKELNDCKEHNKTFLITGATGSLASFLIAVIIENNRINNSNNKIIAVTSDIKKAKAKFKNHKDIEFFNYEQKNYQHVDYIIHFASPTRSNYFVEHPVETFDSIVNLTNKFLSLSKKQKARFLFISSMEAYGIVNDRKSRLENDLGSIVITSPRSSYSLGKRSAEALCNFYYSQYKCDVRIARLAQTFGAGSDINDTRLYCYAAKSVLNNKDIILKTDGQSYGNYVYLSDCMRAIIAILFNGKNGETYNVSNAKANVKIIEFCKRFATNKVRVITEPSKNCYPVNTKLNMSTLKICKIGWKCKYNLTEMINRYMLYLKQDMKINFLFKR